MPINIKHTHSIKLNIFSFLLTILLSFNFFSLTLIDIPKPTYAISQFGAEAVAVLGQEQLTDCTSGPNGGNYHKSTNNPFSLPRIYDNKLIIPDANFGRVLIFNSVPTSNHAVPDVVLGQETICTVWGRNIVEPSYLSLPVNIFFDGTRFYIADRSSNRVLIFNNGIPTENNASADIALGQPDLYSNTANNGGISADTFNAPYGIWSNGVKLIISDMSNNRVLIWNSIPNESGISADIVIGQPNMTSNTVNNGGISGKSLRTPRGIHVDSDGRLYIADYDNHRILVFNSIPTSNFATADYVIGQPNLTSATANNGGIAANRLYNPTETFTDEGKLFIGDMMNNRILIYNSIPTVSNASADIVLGQPNMTSNTANNGGISASSLYRPYGAFSNGEKLVTLDYYNNRALIWNTIPTENAAPADVVIFQPDMTSNTQRGQTGVTARTMFMPMGMSYENGKTFIMDYANHRILGYNGLPTDSNQAADFVLGQSDFSSSSYGTSASKFKWGINVFTDGSHLFLADSGNNRVLIWNSVPSSTNVPADIVIGQPNMTSATANNGGRSAKSLYSPQCIYSDGQKLYICDSGNSRVLVFNSIPETDFASADLVIGQSDFISGSANQGGGVTANTLYFPGSVKINNNRLFISDVRNNRVLIFNTIPTSNNPSADVVVGQQNMTSNTQNQGFQVPVVDTLNYPMNIDVVNSRLWVVDYNNNRVLIFNEIPTENGVEADAVLGQHSFSDYLPGASPSKLYSPRGILVTDNHIFISDRADRVMIYETGPHNTTFTTNNISNNQTINITLTADDAKEVMISEDNSFTGAAWETYSNSKEYTLSNTTEGTKTIYVKMRDYAHYEGEVLSSSLTYDKTSPNGSVTFNSGDEITNNLEATLTLSASDSLSGVTSMMVSNSSSFSGSTWESYSTSKDWTLSTGDGIKTVYVKFKDAAGNISTIYTDTITLDTGIPEGPITVEEGITHEETLYVKEEIVTLNLEGTDELSEIVLMMISEDPNFEGGSWESYSNTKDWNLSQGDGIKVIYVKYRDGAGNESQIYSLSLIFDTQTTINLSKIGNQDFNSDLTSWDTIETKPTFQGTGEVDATVTISIHSNQEITGTATVDSEGNWSYTPETALALGEHTIDISSQDIAGNTDDLNFNLNVLGDTNTTPIELPDTGTQATIIFLMVIVLFWTATNLRIINKLKSFMKR